MEKKIIYNPNLAKNYNLYHEQPEIQFQAQIKKIQEIFADNTKTIDVGAGAGRLLQILQNGKDATKFVGIEFSENMHKTAIENGCQNCVLGDASDTERMAEIRKSQGIDSAYFSFSIHQIIKDKELQPAYIDSLFESGLQKICLITALCNNFNENFFTRYIQKGYDEDLKRFMFAEEFIRNFSNYQLTIESITYYNKISKVELFDKIRNKFVSTLQLLEEQEIEELIEKIDKNYLDDYVVYPDYYSYVTIQK